GPETDGRRDEEVIAAERGFEESGDVAGETGDESDGGDDDGETNHGDAGGDGGAGRLAREVAFGEGGGALPRKDKGDERGEEIGDGFDEGGRNENEPDEKEKAAKRDESDIVGDESREGEEDEGDADDEAFADLAPLFDADDGGTECFKWGDAACAEGGQETADEGDAQAQDDGDEDESGFDDGRAERDVKILLEGAGGECNDGQAQEVAQAHANKGAEYALQ